MYLVSTDIRSKIHNEEYSTALKMLLARIELIELHLSNNNAFRYALDDLIKHLEAEAS